LEKTDELVKIADSLK